MNRFDMENRDSWRGGSCRTGRVGSTGCGHSSAVDRHKKQADSLDPTYPMFKGGVQAGEVKLRSMGTDLVEGPASCWTMWGPRDALCEAEGEFGVV